MKKRLGFTFEYLLSQLFYHRQADATRQASISRYRGLGEASVTRQTTSRLRFCACLFKLLGI